MSRRTTAILDSSPESGFGTAAHERLLLEGAPRLSDAELLAVIVAVCGVETIHAHETAGRLLCRFGTLQGVFAATVSELAGATGSNVVAADGFAAIAAVAEIARRIVSRPLVRAERVDSSRVVNDHFSPLLAGVKRESFHVLLLDSKNGLMAKVRISEGSLGASLVHPREAFRPAVRAAAAAVIFVHNHPSGDPSPSREDHEVTARLRDAGCLLGIPVLDHVVVAAHGYYSFADHGWT